MSAAIETSSPEAKTEQIRAQFTQLLAKTNKEHPAAKDVRALAGLLEGPMTYPEGSRMFFDECI